MSALEPEALADLLPLYAGGDLDEATRVAVAAALEDDPAARAALDEFEALEELLTDALAPEGEDAPLPEWLAALEARAEGAPAERPAEPAPEPAPAPAPQKLVLLIKRTCPYCKDALAAEALVFCAGCATPHHEGCFAHNRGCALLGCGATEAIGAGEAIQACEACGQSTPAGAPFCARCGAATGSHAPARPLHERPREAASRRQGWGSFLAAAGLLLAAGLGAGGLFGVQQVPLLEGLADGTAYQAGRNAELTARQALLEVALQQRTYRERDLDGNGRADYAPSLAYLDTVLEGHGLPGIGRTLEQAERGYVLQFVCGVAGDRFGLLAVPQHGVRGAHALYVDADGNVRRLDRGPWTLDTSDGHLIGPSQQDGQGGQGGQAGQSGQSNQGGQR